MLEESMAKRGRKTRGKAGYMISAVAEMYNIHPQTLRLYEREGLLIPSRSEGNKRFYTDEDLERLRELGVAFETDVVVGKTLPIDGLLDPPPSKPTGRRMSSGGGRSAISVPPWVRGTRSPRAHAAAQRPAIRRYSSYSASVILPVAFKRSSSANSSSADISVFCAGRSSPTGRRGRIAM